MSKYLSNNVTEINERLLNVLLANVVYVWTTINSVDTQVNLPFEQHVVTRFVFNDEGKVEAIGNISEDRFVLEQTGYTISR